jgi:hypothetical protein
MTNKVNVGALIDKDYAKAFHSRCIEHNTTMSAVIKDAMKQYMISHPGKETKFTGVS